MSTVLDDLVSRLGITDMDERLAKMRSMADRARRAFGEMSQEQRRIVLLLSGCAPTVRRWVWHRGPEGSMIGGEVHPNHGDDADRIMETMQMADLSMDEMRELLAIHSSSCPDVPTPNSRGFASCDCGLDLWIKGHGRADINSGVNTGTSRIVRWQHQVIVPRFPLRWCGRDGCRWRPLDDRDALMESDDAWRAAAFAAHLHDAHGVST